MAGEQGGLPAIAGVDATLDVSVKSKRELLERLAGEAASRLERSEEEILQALEDRERLGSTAVGKGVAFPHAQISGTFAPLLQFRRLRRPIDFDDRDGEPVDLVFLALWPETAPKGSLLEAVAEICRRLRNPELLRSLREVAHPEDAAGLLNRALAFDAGADARKSGR